MHTSYCWRSRIRCRRWSKRQRSRPRRRQPVRDRRVRAVRYKPRAIVLLAIVLVTGTVAASVLFAQQRGGWGGRGRGGYDRDSSDRNGVPDWEIDANFKHDLFTFVRVRYSSAYGGYGYRGRGRGDWATDYPDSDLNFSFRLQQLTSLRVDPQPKIIELTDDALFDYPFIYMIEPGGLLFSDAE